MARCMVVALVLVLVLMGGCSAIVDAGGVGALVDGGADVASRDGSLDLDGGAADSGEAGTVLDSGVLDIGIVDSDVVDGGAVDGGAHVDDAGALDSGDVCGWTVVGDALPCRPEYLVAQCNVACVVAVSAWREVCPVGCVSGCDGVTTLVVGEGGRESVPCLRGSE